MDNAHLVKWLFSAVLSASPCTISCLCSVLAGFDDRTCTKFAFTIAPARARVRGDLFTVRSLPVLVRLIETFAQGLQLSRYRFNLDSHASQSIGQFRHFWILLGQLNGFRVEILQLLEHCRDR